MEPLHPPLVSWVFFGSLYPSCMSEVGLSPGRVLSLQNSCILLYNKLLNDMCHKVVQSPVELSPSLRTGGRLLCNLTRDLYLGQLPQILTRKPTGPQTKVFHCKIYSTVPRRLLDPNPKPDCGESKKSTLDNHDARTMELLHRLT